MLTKILTGGNPSVEVVTPLRSRSKQKTTVLLTVDGQDTKLEVRLGARNEARRPVGGAHAGAASRDAVV